MPQDFFENVGSSLKVLRKEIAAISELNDIKRDIDEVIENINSPLLVMVMGEFSRGKSTFINALVGQSIAMVDAKPTTAVITKLSYGKKDKITVFMRDGSVKDYDTDSFARLTAQGSDESNKLHKEIDYVERTLPIEMLKSMSIIDSPGLNSINDVHEAATKRFMDKADTVIWLFDANDPCKQTEIDALKRLNPRLAPLVLVNKIDVIDEDEGDTPEKVLAKIERDLSNNKLEYQKIIGISAKMAFKGKVNDNQKLVTASNINEFYDAVDTIILPNREKFKRISMVDELARVFFSAGRILNGKREENNNRKNDDYSAYIGTEESLACALDELENAADIVMTEIDSAQTARRKRLNPAEKTFYGALYWHGLLEKKDRKTAQKYTEEAAVRGDAVAQMNLAEMYQELGQEDKAEYWFQRLGKTRKVGENAESAYSKAEKYAKDGKYTEAVTWDRKAAEAGNADAMANLGYVYDYGVGVEKDKAEALKWYKEAIKAGFNDATVKKRIKDIEAAQSSAIGFQKTYQAERANNNSSISAEEMYRKAEQYYQTHSFAEAVKWYHKAAEARNADAMANLGYAYYYGVGVEKDKAEALKWYKKAIKAGCNDATVKKRIKEIESAQSSASGFQNIYQEESTNKNSSLSANEMYRKAEEYYQTHNFAEAVKWYRKEAEAGNSAAMNILGCIYYRGEVVKEDKAEAVKWYRKAAEVGNADAMFILGWAYRTGDGVERDESEAVKWYRKAAEAGNADAMSNLGLAYEHGRGVKENKAEAVKWYRKAAETGNADAMYRLGYAYENGEGVKKDEAEAVNWYRKAAEAGDVFAIEDLADLYKKQDNNAEALKWYKKAADFGDVDAMEMLRDMYFCGDGVERDESEAKKWYKRALDAYIKRAECGDADTMYEIGEMYSGCYGVEEDENEAEKWYKRALSAYIKCAECGDADAMYKIGEIYECGTGIQKNNEEALRWYRDAAETGDERAKEKVSDMVNTESLISNLRKYRESATNIVPKNKKSFRIVVIGEFSRGKSTFINALLGCRLLKSRKSPTTAISTKIVSGSGKGAELFYSTTSVYPTKSGRISREDFFQIVHNCNVDKEQLEAEFDAISYAEIESESEFLSENNIEIVDTPGTNYLETSNKYLKDADAVIVVTSATQELTQSEVEELRYLYNVFKNVFVVANFADSLGEKEKQLYVQSIEKELLNSVPSEYFVEKHVFFVDSKGALLFRRKENGEELSAKQLKFLPNSFQDTGIQDFENALLTCIAKHAGEIF